MPEPNLGLIPMEIYAETLIEAKQHMELIGQYEKIIPSSFAIQSWSLAERQLVANVQTAVNDAKILKASKTANPREHLKALRFALQETVREAIPPEFIIQKWHRPAQTFVRELQKVSEV